MAEPLSSYLQTAGLYVLNADQPINEAPPSLDKVREAVVMLRRGKAAGICNITLELVKAGGNTMICGLHTVLSTMWRSGAIPPDWKRGLVIPVWKGKEDRQNCNNYCGYNTTRCTRQSSRSFTVYRNSLSLAEAPEI